MEIPKGDALMVGHEEVLGLYYLVGGTILFSEDVIHETGGELSYCFDPRKTLVVQPVQHGNQVQVQMGKLSEGLGKPGSLTVPETAIIMIHSVTDRNLLSQMRGALAGLVIPGGIN